MSTWRKLQDKMSRPINYKQAVARSWPSRTQRPSRQARTPARFCLVRRLPMTGMEIGGGASSSRSAEGDEP